MKKNYTSGKSWRINKKIDLEKQGEHAHRDRTKKKKSFLDPREKSGKLGNISFTRT